MPSLFSRSQGTRKPNKSERISQTLPSKKTDHGDGPSGSGVRSFKPPKGRETRNAQDASTSGPSLGEFGALSPIPISKGKGAVTLTLPSNTVGPLTPPDSPGSPPPPPPLLPQKYAFLPTRMSTMATSTSVDSFMYASDDVTGLRQYGFLGGVGAKVVLGLEDVAKVIKDVSRELIRRGLTTPMLFSNQALDLNPTRTRMLIQNYIDCHNNASRRGSNGWIQDLEYAREHELAWFLRWSLSRITRMREGTRSLSHGVLEWECYEEWRGRERASNYPLDAFPFLSSIVPSEVFHLILIPLFGLLSRFAAYSHLTGLTPHTLSSLFAPLIFDVPASSSCLASHSDFVRAASATEHLLLAYIRSSSRQGGLGLTDLPSRLKEWVAGYPVMVASDADLARATPRKGARVIRCERAARTVRAYSRDLIINAESWSADVVGSWDAWDRVVLKGRRGETGRPKFSHDWRKKMAVKETLPLPSSSSSKELNRKISYGRAQKPGSSPLRDRRGNLQEVEEEEARWGSLAGKEWSIFEEGGFDSPSKDRDDFRTKLQFDLMESAKQSIGERRKTLDWTDFASDDGGFNRTDQFLNMSLTFASPVSEQITDWPKEREELQKRLHKSQKTAVPFNYDTTPLVGARVAQDPGSKADGKGRVYLEEAFVDCWADWMMGGEWADRSELTFKEANWALIEYKARPSRPEDVESGDPLADPRTSTLYFLFEEQVPLEYQIAIADPKQKKTFANLFSSKKRRGQGGTPKSPRGPGGYNDEDFDRMLSRSGTKRVTLSKPAPANPGIWSNNTVTRRESDPTAIIRNGEGLASPLRTPRKSADRKQGRASGDDYDDPKMSEGKASFFSKNKDKVVRRVKTDEDTRGKHRRQKQQELEFELHSASGLSSPDDGPDNTKGRSKKPQDDDKWMDILVANGARRMERQDAIAPTPRQVRRGPVEGGLPVTPHPPRQYSPQPPVVPSHDFDPYAAHDGPSQGYGGVQDQQALYDTRSPETSGSVDAGHEIITTPPLEGADIQRFPSGKRKPVPPIDPTEEQADEAPKPPPKSTPRNSQDGLGPELLAPTPTRERDTRDTIHNIVDVYNRDSLISASTSDFEPSSEIDSESPMKIPKSTGHNGDGGEDAKERRDPNRLSPDDAEGIKKVDEGRLSPPGIVFDLTPGREPSPARYKHGEPGFYLDQMIMLSRHTIRQIFRL